MRTRNRWLLRILLPLLASAVAAVGCAIALALFDIYWTGHGHRSLGATVLESTHVSLSLLDIMLLAVVALTGLATFLLTLKIR